MGRDGDRFGNLIGSLRPTFSGGAKPGPGSRAAADSDGATGQAAFSASIVAFSRCRSSSSCSTVTLRSSSGKARSGAEQRIQVEMQTCASMTSQPAVND